MKTVCKSLAYASVLIALTSCSKSLFLDKIPAAPPLHRRETIMAINHKNDFPIVGFQEAKDFYDNAIKEGKFISDTSDPRYIGYSRLGRNSNIYGIKYFAPIF